MKSNLIGSERKSVIATSAILLLVLAIYTSRVSPLGATPAAIAGFFILVFALIVSLVYCAVRLFSRATRVNALQMSIVITAIPTVGLALSSLQQFGLTDIVIVTLLVLLVVFYLRKRKLN